jgi:thiamine transport system ATP-binding protein
VALLGPSGCGKSSLLRAIAGLEPSAGQVVLDGRDLGDVPPHRRGIGLMFQGDALFPHRNVGANVAFGLRMQGWSREDIHARVTESLALVGLPGHERRAIDTLSGGEQQRVALARAIAPRPRLLMLDEPLSSVDRALRDRLLEDLPAVFAEVDAAVVYVTHDQAEALALADRVAVMRAGVIVQEGSPAQVWQSPSDAFVADFVGHRTIDVEVHDGIATTPIGRIPAPDHPDGPAVAVIPSPALHPDPDGTVSATVTARRFAGDHAIVVVDAAGITLEVAWRGDDWPAAGDTVTLAIAVDQVRLVDRPADPPA